MKRIFITAILVSAFSFANADENMMSKRGTPILPEPGDWSIGIDAVPFLDWAFDKTRIMSNTGVTSAGRAVTPQDSLTLVGLYVKDANTTYRGRLRLSMRSNKQTEGSVQDSIFTPSETKMSSTNIKLGAGLQKNRGKGRLRGIYGAEAGIDMMGATKTTFSYAKPLDKAQPGTRTTETKQGGGMSFGINGFIGVEYFILAKMSVSAEYGWGINIGSSKAGESSTETIDNAGVITTKTNKTSKSSDFIIDVSDISSIVLHFYF